MIFGNRLLRQRGFTLIELTVVVAIIAILAGIVYPQYSDSVRRANRTDAKNALLDVAARQERFRFGNNAYATTFAQLGMQDSSAQGYYALRLVNVTATAFGANAEPQGGQADDKCEVLTINNTGQKGTVNSHSVPAEECWR